jgi:hypothetical protein
VQSALAYTVAGLLSATLVGFVLGALGRLLGSGRVSLLALYGLALLALLLAAREWGWIMFPLPERSRQTEKFWVHNFGFRWASAMWGLHIGLGFATRVTYGGFWVLVCVAVAFGDPRYGAVLMMVYWLGRALSVWLSPTFVRQLPDTTTPSELVLADGLVYRRVVGIGLGWSAVVLVLLPIQIQTGPLAQAAFFAPPTKMLFALSYALLCGLVVLETTVLQKALRETVMFKRLYAEFSPKQFSKGMSAPEFTASVMGTSKTLSMSQLKGRSAILLFVSGEEISSPLYDNLAAVIHAFWHRVNGNVYLVCSGGEELCGQLARNHQVRGFAADQVPVLLDEGGRIARNFLVNSTPQSVMLDQDARITLYGYPSEQGQYVAEG